MTVTTRPPTAWAPESQSVLNHLRDVDLPARVDQIMTMARSHKAADALLRHPDIPSHIINQYIPDPHTLAILRETCTTLLQAVRDTDPGQDCELVRARGWR